MNIPEQLRYSTDHEWISRDGEIVRVGITDYAQDALGDVVFVQVPAVGANVNAGESFGEVESTKSVSDVYAPVSGVVVQINDGLVDAARLERADADAVLRVVFQSAAELRASTLTDPPRLVLDFSRPQEVSARERSTCTSFRTLVLDAGHGGHDSGAIGPAGLMEKELVLDVTKRVARLLEDKLGVKVLLSRDGDHFIPLRDRTSYANRERADLFVSIHANAHRVVASEGVETYFLSSEATDNASRQVAALENSVVQLEKPSAGRAASRSDVLKTILWELAQSEFQSV